MGDEKARAGTSVPGAQWMRVEFYGLVPYGQVVTDVDPVGVGETLMRSFGFTHLDGLTMVAVADEDKP